MATKWNEKFIYKDGIKYKAQRYWKPTGNTLEMAKECMKLKISPLRSLGGFVVHMVWAKARLRCCGDVLAWWGIGDMTGSSTLFTSSIAGIDTTPSTYIFHDIFRRVRRWLHLRLKDTHDDQTDLVACTMSRVFPQSSWMPVNCSHLM